MLRRTNNGMRELGRGPLRRGAAVTRHGASTPSRQRRLHFAHDWEVVSVSRGATQVAKPRCVDACKVWERVVEHEGLGRADKGKVPLLDNILDGLCRCGDFEISSQRVEHQDHPNRGGSETKGHEEKRQVGTIGRGSLPARPV